MKKTILIAGASGFIGNALIHELLATTDFNIVALSRGLKQSDNPRLVWKKIDLFSFHEVEQTVNLVRPQAVYYLVHSMLPSAHLDQGTFQDYDYILADNFARACEKAKIEQLIYLGGIIPDSKHLSTHLESRREVEKVFCQRGFPVTGLRASIILGAQGSSFKIMHNLVVRLPVLICPKWCETLTTPIHIQDAVRALIHVLMAREHFDKIYDIGGSSSHSYLDLMRLLAHRLGLKRIFLTLPISALALSKLWVRLVSGASKELVYPLLSSLKVPMKVNPSRELRLEPRAMTYLEALDLIYAKAPPKLEYKAQSFERNYVRSIQRMKTVPGRDAEWIAREYAEWIPSFLFPFIGASFEKNEIIFYLFFKRWVLLRLLWAQEQSREDRCIFLIENGWLVNKTDTGRLEFLISSDGRHIFAAIHDFYPSLPWYFYRFTQAKAHLWVMRNFSKHLSQHARKTQISQA